MRAGLEAHDAGHGYDPFGLSLPRVRRTAAWFRPLHRHYFRVHSQGSEHVPRAGAALLAANHSGTLPVDGLMLWEDVVLHTGRVPRVVADAFVPGMPFVGTFFARGGMVGGARANVRALLEAGELVTVFPEGVPGIAKPFAQRYRLQPFRVGHAELALRHRVPVVPVAIVGAEEALPQLLKLERLGRLFGWPHIPVPAVPFPLPARLHIHYGAPLHLYEGRAPGDADLPEVAHAAAEQVRAAVARLIEDALRERRGIFR